MLVAKTAQIVTCFVILAHRLGKCMAYRNMHILTYFLCIGVYRQFILGWACFNCEARLHTYVILFMCFCIYDELFVENMWYTKIKVLFPIDFPFIVLHTNRIVGTTQRTSGKILCGGLWVIRALGVPRIQTHNIEDRLEIRTIQLNTFVIKSQLANKDEKNGFSSFSGPQSNQGYSGLLSPEIDLQVVQI